MVFSVSFTLSVLSLLITSFVIGISFDMTLFESASFVLYVMSKFEYQNAGICSKSISIAKRNLIAPLKQMLYSLGFEVNENRSGNYLEIYNGEVFNVFHLFGGRCLCPNLIEI